MYIHDTIYKILYYVIYDRKVEANFLGDWKDYQKEKGEREREGKGMLEGAG